MLAGLPKLEFGTLRPGGDGLGEVGVGMEMRGWFCGAGRGNTAPTSGNIESVASSWASSAASVLHRPGSQTCSTSRRTWNTERPPRRDRDARRGRKRNIEE